MFSAIGRLAALALFTGCFCFAFTASAQESDEGDTYYYEYSTVQFCESVDNLGNPVDVVSTFLLGAENTVNVTVYIDNAEDPLNASTLSIEIYDETNSPVDSYTVNIQREWNYVHFVHKFTKPGTYIFDIYNGAETFINSGTVVIEE